MSAQNADSPTCSANQEEEEEEEMILHEPEVYGYIQYHMSLMKIYLGHHRIASYYLLSISQRFNDNE